jgi:alpha-L-fucosidase 2
MEDIDDPKDQHRHNNHMVGVYPGRQIHPTTTPEFAQAAKVGLVARGNGPTGWSKAWKVSIFARLLEADHAYSILSDLMATKVHGNLWTTHPPFQIDGNFGYASGVCEMLIQSHMGQIHLLPALPKVWSQGQVKGIRARGSFEFDIKWNKGKLTEALIRSEKGSDCTLRTTMPVIVKQDGKKVKVKELEPGVVSFPTEAGKQYQVEPNVRGN